MKLVINVLLLERSGICIQYFEIYFIFEFVGKVLGFRRLLSNWKYFDEFQKDL